MYIPLKNMQESASTSATDSESANIKIKAPKRVLHFSDGVLEEYSDDEVDSTPPNKQNALVDPKSLRWGPWISYQAWAAGSKALSVCDYLGEGLASILGITTPKYWYEIEEYKRMEAEKQERKEQAEGWSEPSPAGDVDMNTIKTDQPVSSSA